MTLTKLKAEKGGRRKGKTTLLVLSVLALLPVFGRFAIWPI